MMPNAERSFIHPARPQGESLDFLHPTLPLRYDFPLEIAGNARVHLGDIHTEYNGINIFLCQDICYLHRREPLFIKQGQLLAETNALAPFLVTSSPVLHLLQFPDSRTSMITDHACRSMSPSCSSDARDGTALQSRQYNWPPNEQDWQAIRPEFCRLCLDERRTLNEAIRELQQGYGFHATGKMFKHRIKLWGAERNLKQNEVECIIAIQANRAAQGKQTEFYLHGRLVNMLQVYQYQQRIGLKTSEAIARFDLGRTELVQDLRCNTPNPPSLQLRVDNDTNTFELSLRSYKSLLVGLIENGSCCLKDHGWTFDDPGRIVFHEAHYDRSIAEDLRAGDLTRIRQVALAMEKMLKSWNLFRLTEVMEYIWSIDQYGFDDIAKLLLFHLAALFRTYLSASDPRTEILSYLAQMGPKSLSRQCIAFCELDAETAVDVRPTDVGFQLPARTRAVWMRTRLGYENDKSSMESILDKCLSHFGLLDSETLYILQRGIRDGILTSEHSKPYHEALSEVLSQKLFDAEAFRLLPLADGTIWTTRTVVNLSFVYRSAGHTALAYALVLSCLNSQDLISLYLFEEYDFIVMLDGIARQMDINDNVLHYWRERKQEIENIWAGELNNSVC